MSREKDRDFTAGDHAFQFVDRHRIAQERRLRRQPHDSVLLEPAEESGQIGVAGGLDGHDVGYGHPAGLDAWVIGSPGTSLQGAVVKAAFTRAGRTVGSSVP